jgi:hypothetical protein
MKALLLAAAAISGLGTSSAHADGGVPPANTMFTQFPGVLAEAPHVVAPGSSEQGVEDYATQSNRVTWSFPPNPNGGDNQ